MVAPGKGQFGVFGKRGAGLVDAPPAGGDQAGQDQRLRLSPAFGKALLYEQLIGPPLRSHFTPMLRCADRNDGGNRVLGVLDIAVPVFDQGIPIKVDPSR